MSEKSSLKNQDINSKTLLGFWIYLMTDALLFASLFATYAVLRNNTAQGASASELFNLPFVFFETIILLISSYTAGIAVYLAKTKNIKISLVFLMITFILGSIFLSMEITEFIIMTNEGSGWTNSAFTASYYTLVGTHGLHILIGLLWLSLICFMIIKRGFNNMVYRRAVMWGMYWHFLDIIWIFIFTMVYLFGALNV